MKSWTVSRETLKDFVYETKEKYGLMCRGKYGFKGRVLFFYMMKENKTIFYANGKVLVGRKKVTMVERESRTRFLEQCLKRREGMESSVQVVGLMHGHRREDNIPGHKCYAISKDSGGGM